jgi:hypothetical protein
MVRFKYTLTGIECDCGDDRTSMARGNQSTGQTLRCTQRGPLSAVCEGRHQQVVHVDAQRGRFDLLWRPWTLCGLRCAPIMGSCEPCRVICLFRACMHLTGCRLYCPSEGNVAAVWSMHTSRRPALSSTEQVVPLLVTETIRSASSPGSAVQKYRASVCVAKFSVDAAVRHCNNE